jgi:signal transduction histidine kinase
VTWPRALASISFRLSALYTLLFVVSVLALGVAVFIITRNALSDQLDSRVMGEARGLVDVYGEGGLPGLRQEVLERSRLPGRLDYGLIGPRGERLGGVLEAPAGAAAGFRTVHVHEPGEEVEEERLLVTPLAGGARLLVSDSVERNEEVLHVILQAFASTVLFILLLGGLGGFMLSRAFLSRIDIIGRTADGIITGDLSRRIPLDGRAEDELSRLAATLNRMLDRIELLLESLRQVSNDIAHDLRTPLTRLRQRLEAAQTPPSPEAGAQELEGALAETDGLLATFEALLRIAQIEAGTRRAGFRPVDLTALARRVVEAYVPSAEDMGASLQLTEGGAAHIEGDSELLVQMLANLVENSLTHAGSAPAIGVAVVSSPGGGAQLSVQDNGAGIPPEARERVLERFYRLDQNRSTLGSGLGLALVRAIARLHDADISLIDAAPGLHVAVTFPAPSAH